MDLETRHPLDTRRPFSRADAVAAGISPATLRGSRFRRVFRDVYVDAAVRGTEAERIDAALLLHPASAFVSHTTAARLRGVVVPDTSLVHVSVLRDVDRRWRPGIKPHVAPVGTEVDRHQGRRISSPLRMFVELAAVLELVDLVVAGDSMLRVLGLTADQLRSGLRRTRDYWSGAARAAARYVRDRVDSPMETRLRMLLVLAGLPEPEVNLEIRGDDGQVLMRFDLAYRERRVAVEYEGRHHVEVVDAWERDILRDEGADLLGWLIIKVTARGIYIDPGRTLDRVWEALRSRGPVLPRPGDDWQPHFRGRD